MRYVPEIRKSLRNMGGSRVDFLARCLSRTLARVPLYEPCQGTRLAASSFETHRRHVDRVLSLVGEQSNSFATYPGSGIDKIHLTFGARQRLRELTRDEKQTSRL